DRDAGGVRGDGGDARQEGRQLRARHQERDGGGDVAAAPRRVMPPLWQGGPLDQRVGQRLQLAGVESGLTDGLVAPAIAPGRLRGTTEAPPKPVAGGCQAAGIRSTIAYRYWFTPAATPPASGSQGGPSVTAPPGARQGPTAPVP